MYPGKLSFNRYDPFRKQDIVLEKSFPEDGYHLQARPFWPCGDIKVVIGWLKNTLTLQNTGMVYGQKTLFLYYRDMLDSDTAQPLIITLNGREVALFTLIPAQLADINQSVRLKAFDCCLQFIIPENNTHTNFIQNCLHILISYFFELRNTGNLYLFVSAGDFKTNIAATGAGFHLLANYSTEGETKNLYEYSHDLFQKNLNR